MFLLFLTTILAAAEGGGQLSIGIMFWIIFIIGLIFGGYWNRTDLGGWFAGSLFWWVLLFLLGVGTFGFPIRF